MAAKKQVAKAGMVAAKARYNPYVQLLMEDEDLRQNLVDAYTAGRGAYSRLRNGKSPTTQIFDDKKLQKELKTAAESIRDASMALREAPKKKRSGGIAKLLVLALIGGAAALALSEGLRKKVLDTLFGAEEEFEYTSTTTAPPPPAGAPTGTGTTS